MTDLVSSPTPPCGTGQPDLRPQAARPRLTIDSTARASRTPKTTEAGRLCTQRLTTARSRKWTICSSAAPAPARGTTLATRPEQACHGPPRLRQGGTKQYDASAPHQRQARARCRRPAPPRRTAARHGSAALSTSHATMRTESTCFAPAGSGAPRRCTTPATRARRRSRARCSTHARIRTRPTTWATPRCTPRRPAGRQCAPLQPHPRPAPRRPLRARGAGRMQDAPGRGRRRARDEPPAAHTGARREPGACLARPERPAPGAAVV